MRCWKRPRAGCRWSLCRLPKAWCPSCRQTRRLVGTDVSSRALTRALLAALATVRPGQRYAHPWVEMFRMDCAIQGYEQLIDETLDNRSARPSPARAMNHVAFVIPTFDQMAGAERQVMLLACGLAQRNWQVSVVAFSGSGGDAAEQLRRAGIRFSASACARGSPIRGAGFDSDVAAARVSGRGACASAPRGVAGALVARGAPAPVVIDTLHTSAIGGWGRRTGYRISKWLPDRVSAVSEGVAQAHRSARMVLPQRLVVIPNGVDVDPWRPIQGRAKPSGGGSVWNEFLWFAAGRLDPVKDYPALLWAMLEIPRPVTWRSPEPDPRRRAARIAEQLGIEARVHFLGFQPDMLPWMQAADAFVLSSRWEGLPMSLLEAGACALPAVATDVPGTRRLSCTEKQGSSQAGMTPFSEQRDEPDDADGCAGAIGHGTTRAPPELEQYSLSRVLDQWELLYRELADARPSNAKAPPPLSSIRLNRPGDHREISCAIRSRRDHTTNSNVAMDHSEVASACRQRRTTASAPGSA